MSPGLLGLVGAGLVLASAAALHRAWAVTGRWTTVGRLPAEPAPPVDPGLRLGRPAPPARLAPALAAAGVGLAADVVWAGWLGGVTVAVAAGWMTGGPALAALAGVVGAAAPLLALRAFAGRGQRRYEAAVPAVLDAVARSLRSGGSLRQAVAEAAAAAPPPVADDLAAVVRQADHGVPLVRALEAWAERRPAPAVRLAVAALCLGSDTGGGQARAVDGVAATVRERLALAAEVRALSSQARYSALVIAVAPLAFCAFATATDARTATFLFRTPLGLLLLAAGLTLDAVAALWMARIVRGAG